MMPHAIADDLVPAPVMTNEDIDIPDAPPAGSEDADSDKTVSQNTPPEKRSATDSGPNQDVKLEDLFNDDDEDDDYNETTLGESSPPGLDTNANPPAAAPFVFHKFLS